MAAGLLTGLEADWGTLGPLLDEALTLPPSDRPGWLEAVKDRPGLAPGLHESLKRLLHHPAVVETRGFLSTLTPVPFAGGGPDAPAPGARIGPWRLLRELGRGGMGHVFLAERADGVLKRQVALKLPRLTWADDLARRMARERDVLAGLEHPHIARLYDAGVDEVGRPWLALEYVQGQPLDRHAALHSLTIGERLALLQQVGAAVAYAHGRLVVHGDLKPANILVTPEGQVRLLDFGIARLLQADGGAGDDGGSTLLGRGLTPDYASPEQLRGERLGTSSDIYSLGVVAFELLSGHRPVPVGDGREPPLASEAAVDRATRHALRGDADAVLAQALHADRARRYASVDAMVQDLQRLRRGEPVAARRDEVWRRWRQRAWRQRLPLGLAGGVALALLGGAHAQAAVALALASGAGVAWWQRNRARQEADAAREAARLAARQTERDERVKRFALSILEGANPDEGAGAGTTALDLLRRARGELEAELGATSMPPRKCGPPWAVRCSAWARSMRRTSCCAPRRTRRRWRWVTTARRPSARACTKPRR